MCRRCGYEPYLAGHLVVFPLPRKQVPTTVVGEDGREKTVLIELADRPRGYTGVCVRHHKGWVTIRTRSLEYSMPAVDVLAYDAMI